MKTVKARTWSKIFKLIQATDAKILYTPECLKYKNVDVIKIITAYHCISPNVYYFKRDLKALFFMENKKHILKNIYCIANINIF